MAVKRWPGYRLPAASVVGRSTQQANQAFMVYRSGLPPCVPSLFGSPSILWTSLCGIGVSGLSDPWCVRLVWIGEPDRRTSMHATFTHMTTGSGSTHTGGPSTRFLLAPVALFIFRHVWPDWGSYRLQSSRAERPRLGYGYRLDECGTVAGRPSFWRRQCTRVGSAHGGPIKSSGEGQTQHR